jgi:hypothetical protein
MFLGRVTQGQFLPIPVTTRDGGTPYAPTAAPLVTIYNSTGTKIALYGMPPVDKGAITGLFVAIIRMNSLYPVGKYRLAVNFTANSVPKLVVGHFEVVDGGHADGAVNSMYFYPRPHSNFLVEKLDSNQRLLLTNPRAF